MSRSASENPVAVSIVIATRNRRDELRRALLSCASQDCRHVEISVYDDNSDDGTVEMLADEFPQVLIHRPSERVGYITLRNRAYQDTSASFVLSMDDDAFLTDRSTLSALLDLMEADPRIGALAIPYLEVSPEGRATRSSDTSPGSELKSFVGTAHLCRVSAVREVGGYRDFLVHQGEERDLCIRLRASGWSIRMASAPPIVHLVSPNRDRSRMHRYGVRNQVLYDFFYTPWFITPVVAAANVCRLLAYRVEAGWIARTLVYAMEGVRACWTYREYRSPLTFAAYRSHIALPGHGPHYIDKTELPSPCGAHTSLVAVT